MSSEVVAPIESALQAIDQHAYALLVALGGVGIVSMALVQLFKDLLPTRLWFQRWWFKRWFTEGAARSGVPEESVDETLQELVNLATEGDERALYELPVEQFTGQLNAAMQAVLDDPQNHPALVQVLAQRANPEDIRILILGPPSPTVPDFQKLMDDYLQRRNRIAHHIQRSLDAIQIAMGSRWRFILHVVSILIGTVIILAALTIYGGREFWTGERFAYALVVAVLGGFIAPIARDLVAAIQSLRSRTT